MEDARWAEGGTLGKNRPVSNPLTSQPTPRGAAVRGVYHRRINTPHRCRRGARRAEARKAAFAPAGRLYPSHHGVPRCSRVPGGRAITHAPTRGTREGVTRPREARWLMARQSLGPFEAERMTADDEGDDSSRLLSRQGPDLQDGGASSETRDHIFASRDENPDSWPPAAAGRLAKAH